MDTLTGLRAPGKHAGLRSFRCLQLGLVLALLPVAASGSSRLVPEEYATIQAAIDACVQGDSVSVAPGIYRGGGNTNLLLNGRGIVLHSRSGAESTTIDCEGRDDCRCLAVWGAPPSVVDGFTITGGNALLGGGGLYVGGSAPIIRRCIIAGNTVEPGSGGLGGAGIFIRNGAAPTIEDCVIRDNSTGAVGGGILVRDESSVDVRRCRIYGNSAGDGGGVGTYDSGGSVRVSDCVIAGNTATAGSGGGIYGGGQYGYVVERSVVCGNRAEQYGGGGISMDSWNSVITDCTIADNRAGSYGGGVECSGKNTLILRTILRGNCASVGTDLAIGGLHAEAELHCVAVDSAGIAAIYGGVLLPSDGIVSDDPRFCGPLDCGQAPPPGGDYRLRSDSPCLPQFSPCGLLIGALGQGCAAPDPVGACCIDTICYLRTRTECAQQQGFYQGDGVSCYPDPCFPIAIEQTTWGRLKAKFR